MKILKFNESKNSDQLLKNLFDEASQEFEELRDYFLEIEDSKSFLYGFNYCAYYPKTEKFMISAFLCEDFRSIKSDFSESSIDEILDGVANISFMIGVGCVPENLSEIYPSFFQGDDHVEDDSNQGYIGYTQLHLSNFVKLTQILKQIDMRISKEKYNIKYQFDNQGVTILIGRKISE